MLDMQERLHGAVDGAVDVGYATCKVLVIRHAIFILRRGFQYGVIGCRLLNNNFEAWC